MIKFHFSRLCIWVLYVGCLFIGILQGEVDERDRSFYALSSLRFYIDQSLFNSSNKEITDHIHFTEDDLTHLWNTALLNSSVFNQIQEIHQLYETTKQQVISKPSVWKEISQKLKQVWIELNESLISEHRQVNEIFSDKLMSKHPHFDQHPANNLEMRLKIEKHLIPLNHPLKESLDRIFKQHRVLASANHLTLAGFDVLFHQPHSLIRVLRHPLLPGHLLKVYLDSEKVKTKKPADWEKLYLRCVGASHIRRLIQKKKMVYFTVPDKWLYLMPSEPQPLTDKKTAQPLVLVVTDMNLVTQEESFQAWKDQVTTRHLDELYCILSHGYSSTLLPFNIPYTRTGHFTCIDTEHPKRELDFDRVRPYLSPEMKNYWDYLVKIGGIL